MTATRGTTNRNVRGNTLDRQRRREWLIQTYQADLDFVRIGSVLMPVDRHSQIKPRIPACRCYRCGTLLSVDTVTVDRIIPGCKGGTYRRNNIRPACGPCNSETGSRLRA